MSTGQTIEELNKALLRRAVAVAQRMPRDPGAGGLGTTVSVRFSKKAYWVCVELFKDDGGYGFDLSRTDTPFDKLEDALEKVRTLRFGLEELDLGEIPHIP